MFKEQYAEALDAARRCKDEGKNLEEAIVVVFNASWRATYHATYSTAATAKAVVEVYDKPSDSKSWIARSSEEPMEDKGFAAKCECGATTASIPWHSDWCPLHKEDK